MGIKQVEVQNVIDKEAVVLERIQLLDVNDESLTIEKGDKIKVVGYSYSEYCFVCEHNGKQFTIPTVNNEKPADYDPDYEIIIQYV